MNNSRKRYLYVTFSASCNFKFLLQLCIEVYYMVLKRHKLRFLSGKYCVWKLKKDFNLSLNVILKQISLILKRFPLECSYNGVSIHICLQANNISYWLNEWRFKIYHECWTLRFRRKRLPKTRIYCLFFMYKFWRREKKTPKFTGNAALSFFILFVIIYTS